MLVFDLQLVGDQLPGDHGAEVILVLVVNGGDEQVGDLGADLDIGPHRQVLVVGQDLALVGRVLVEDVDRRAQGVLGLDGQVPLELAQSGQRGGVDVDDLQVAVGHEHVRGRVLQHRRQPRLLALDALALADVLPVDDVPEDVVARAEDAVDLGLERDVAEAELGLVRQGGRVAQDALHAPLVLVEAVNGRADDVVHFDVEGLADLALDAAQGFQGPVVGVDDVERRCPPGRCWPGRSTDWPAESRANPGARSCSARGRRRFRRRCSSWMLRSFPAQAGEKWGVDDVGFQR